MKTAVKFLRVGLKLSLIFLATGCELPVGSSNNVQFGNAVQSSASNPTASPTGTAGSQAALSCTFNGNKISSGESVTVYLAQSVAYGASCSSIAQTISCNNGILPVGIYFPSCAEAAPDACMFNGQSVPSGGSVVAYQTSSVTFGSSCASQSRSCTNGALSGSYAYSACNVGQPAACIFNGQSVISGQSVNAYTAQSVPYGSNCTSVQQNITCTNGSFPAGVFYPNCSVAQASACVFNGQTIASGSSVLAFQSPTVDYGSLCSPQNRSCTNGALSGNYNYSSCVVEAAPPAEIHSFSASSSTITAGSSTTLIWSTSGATTLSISSGVGVENMSAGSVTVSPSVTTVYTLTATPNSGSPVTQSVTITVNPQPSASCLFGGQNIASGSSVTAYQISTVPFGSTCVSQTDTCSNGIMSGSYTFSSCTVLPNTNPIINSYTVSSSSITMGGSVTLNWSTTNTTGVYISLGGVALTSPTPFGFPSQGSQTLSPLTTTTYTLIAESSSGMSADQSLTVTVTPPISLPGPSPSPSPSAPGLTTLQILSKPSSALAGQSMSIVMQAVPVIADGTLCSLSIVSNPAGGLIGGNYSGVAYNSGVTQFSGVTLTKVGTYTLRAQCAGITAISTPSTPIVITAGEPSSISVITAPPSSVQSGQIFSPSFLLLDAFGNPVPGSGGPYELGASSSQSNAGFCPNCSSVEINVGEDGVGNFPGLNFVPTTSGTYTLTIGLNSNLTTRLTFPITVSAIATPAPAPSQSIFAFTGSVVASPRLTGLATLSSSVSAQGGGATIASESYYFTAETLSGTGLTPTGAAVPAGTSTTGPHYSVVYDTTKLPNGLNNLVVIPTDSNGFVYNSYARGFTVQILNGGIQTTTVAAGGTGGSAYTDLASAGSLLYGLQTTVFQTIDSIAPIWTNGSVGQTHGSPQPPIQVAACGPFFSSTYTNTDEVVVGMNTCFGNYGGANVLLAFTLICGGPATGFAPDYINSSVQMVGVAALGSNFQFNPAACDSQISPSLMCPAGKAVVGIQGRSGAGNDQVQLICQ